MRRNGLKSIECHEIQDKTIHSLVPRKCVSLFMNKHSMHSMIPQEKNDIKEKVPPAK